MRVTKAFRAANGGRFSATVDATTNANRTAGDAPKHWTWRLVESAAPLALATAFLYFLGYMYFDGFYSRLSFPSPYPQHSTADYSVRALSSLSSWAFLILAVAMVWLLRDFTIDEMMMEKDGWLAPPPITVNDAPLWIAIGWLTTYAFNFENVWPFRLLAWAMLTTLVLNIRGISLIRFFWTVPFQFRFIVAAVVIGYAALFSHAQGETDGKRLIEGNLSRGTTIVLTMADESSPLNGGEFALAATTDDAYYVVQMAEIAPQSVTLQIVPRSEVKLATIYASDT